MLNTQYNFIKVKFFLFLFILGFSGSLYAKNITGAVYTATNHAEENSVIAYKQFDDGTLDKIGEYKTGGKGTGFVELHDVPYRPEDGHPAYDGIDPLESTYALWRTDDNKNVLVVNAGDGTVSSLRVNKDFSLTLNNVVKAGDIKPLAIATHGKLIYVASMGSKDEHPNNGNLKGYTIDDNGILSPISYSRRFLNGRPSSVEFTPGGNFITTVETTTGAIHTFKVLDDGSLSTYPVSSVQAPLDKGRFLVSPIGTKIVSKKGENYLLVTEARLATPKGRLRPSSEANKKKYPFASHYEGQSGSVTSYGIDKDGKLSIVSPDVFAGKEVWGGQQTTCWITASKDGRFAWTTNSFSSSISTFKLDDQGNLTLSKEIAYENPDHDEYYTDMDLSADGNFVNVLSANTGTAWVYAINHDTGSLTLVDSYEGGAKVHTYGIVTISK